LGFESLIIPLVEMTIYRSLIRKGSIRIMHFRIMINHSLGASIVLTGYISCTPPHWVCGVIPILLYMVSRVQA
jgi:hypothetical protein